MNIVKIAVLMKKRFAEFYEIRLYRRHSAEQLIVKKYAANNREIIVDGKK